LSNIYRLLGGSPTDELAVPIKRPRVQALTVAPSARIQPKIDGRVTTYFEWLGAGLYQPDYRSGSMHGATQIVQALYYGYSDKAVYLRLDLDENFLREHSEFEVRVKIGGESRARLHAMIRERGVGAVSFQRGGESRLVPLGTGDQIELAFSQIFELRFDYSILNVKPHERITLQVSIWLNALPLQVLPHDGWLTLELTEDLTSW